MFQIVLVSNQQITMRAVAARLVEREDVHWINMNDQWQFSLVHLAVTLWTDRPSHILIGIEKKRYWGGCFPSCVIVFFFRFAIVLLLLLDKSNGLLELTMLIRLA